MKKGHSGYPKTFFNHFGTYLPWMGGDRKVGLRGPQEVIKINIPEFRSPAHIFENLARTGGPDSEQGKEKVKQKMEAFRNSSSYKRLDKLLSLHVKRYGYDDYQQNDPDCEEQYRMNALLRYGFYMIDNIEAAYEKVLELNHTGISTVFEKTLDAVAQALSKDFSRLNIEAIVVRYAVDVDPFMTACLRITDLEDRLIPPIKIFAEYKEAVKERFSERAEELYGTDKKV